MELALTMGNGVKVEIVCPYCGNPSIQENSAVQRAKRIGAPIYCDRICAGLGRRTHKTKSQKIEEKRLYDERYREENRLLLKAKKAAHFKKTYDPEKAREERKKTMPRHVEYCRQAEYKKWKSQYDQQFRAKKCYGSFWEAAIAVANLEKECMDRMSRYEMDLMNDRLNKTKRRKQNDESLNRRQFERRALGHPEPDKG